MEEERHEKPNLDPSSALQKCIGILKSSKDDNERFAGLLLVTQLVRSEALEAAERRKLFDAVGFTFINRLLSTKDVPQDCPENVFKSLAVTILACFSTDSELLFHPQMVAKIPLFNDVISSSPGEILDDCYQILMSFASSAKGCAHLMRGGSTQILCQVVRERSCSSALEVLLRMLHYCPKDMWGEEGRFLVQILPSLSKKFREAQDLSKFEICKTLVSFLSDAESCSFENYLEETKMDNKWQSDLNKGLQEILQSKISSEQRDPALILVALLADLIGMKWMLTHNTQSPPSNNAPKEANPPELFVTAVSLSSVEIRMILEHSASKEEIISKQSLLSACYEILEKAINFAVSEASLADIEADQNDCTILSRNTVSSVYILATEAVESIMAYLDRASHQRDTDQMSAGEKHVILASVRVLGAWMAEETYALRAGVHNLLPFLLKLGKDALESDLSEKALTNKPEPCTSEVDAELINSVNGLDLSGITDHQPVVLRFLLPGLCHLSADEYALKVLIANQAHALLGKYFFSEWKKWTTQKEDLDSRMTLTTLLGIFLNFTVMKPDLVKRDQIFQDIHQHIVSSVPDVLSHPEYALLLANLVVLGLMLSRHQSVQDPPAQNPADVPDLVPFFRSVVEFLKNCIQSKIKGQDELKTHEQSKLSVACERDWADISGLWFLGLQVVTSLLPDLPCLRVVVKESGWYKEIESYCKADQQCPELSIDIRNALLSFLKESQSL